MSPKLQDTMNMAGNRALKKGNRALKKGKSGTTERVKRRDSKNAFQPQTPNIFQIEQDMGFREEEVEETAVMRECEREELYNRQGLNPAGFQSIRFNINF